MKALSLFYTILTIGISFTMDLWAGTAFALTPLLATIGGIVLRVAAERGDHVIGLLAGSVGGAGSWLIMEWLGLRVELFGLDFAAGWWAILGVPVGFLSAPEEMAAIRY